MTSNYTSLSNVISLLVDIFTPCLLNVRQQVDNFLIYLNARFKPLETHTTEIKHVIKGYYLFIHTI